MIIEKLVVKTGSACTLRCEKCGEFNPYLAGKGKSFMLDAESLSRDVYKIAKAVEKIDTVHVAGGEALLHKDIFLFLSYICTIPNIAQIELVTNGTVMPDDTVLDLIRSLKSKIVVLVSDYSASGVDNNAVIEAFKKNEINFRVMKDMKWQDRSNISNKELSEENLKYIAQNCASYRKNPYYTLNNGIISAHCPTAGSILYYSDLYDKCQGYYMDIRAISNEDMLAELKKINDVEYLPMCNYCIPSWDVKYCQAGKQIEG